MKKTKLMLFVLSLVIGIYFLIPLKVYAAEYPTAIDLVDILDEYGDRNSYIVVQFPSDYVIEGNKIFFVNLIAPSDFSGYYEFNISTDLNYFEPNIRNVILEWSSFEFDFNFEWYVQEMLGLNNYDGYLYWNPITNYFQLNQVDEELLAEFEYYRQRVAELESLVDDLNNQLNLEYDRGYNDGFTDGALGGDYQEGYQEGYQDGFIDGEKSKIAKNNESFYSNIAIWIPAVITIVALTSIISIFGIKKKE